MPKCFERRVFISPVYYGEVWFKAGPSDADWEVRYFGGELDPYEIQRERYRRGQSDWPKKLSG